VGKYEVKRVLAKISRGEGFLDFIKCLYYEFKLTVFNPYVKKSWSPDNEDIIIDRLLNHKKLGFYVDVGAYDPWVGSNTMRFYKKGWKGINIEPDLGRYSKFEEDRKGDINLNIGISDSKSQLIFYVMFPESLSTFSKEDMEKRVSEGFKLVEKRKVSVDTLENILSKYAKDKKVDFINIDTEGFDFNVLKGNNWEKYKPTAVCIEKVEGKKGQEIKLFLEKKGYYKAVRTINNDIYFSKRPS